jgi:hypothetical protein
MKAWVAFEMTGLGAGLGKMDVIIVPLENGNCFFVKITRDGRIWVDFEEIHGQPKPNDTDAEIEIPEDFAEEMILCFKAGEKNLSPKAAHNLTELIKEARSK